MAASSGWIFCASFRSSHQKIGWPLHAQNFVTHSVLEGFRRPMVLLNLRRVLGLRMKVRTSSQLGSLRALRRSIPCGGPKLKPELKKDGIQATSNGA